jgi:hypothetical protein
MRDLFLASVSDYKKNDNEEESGVECEMRVTRLRASPRHGGAGVLESSLVPAAGASLRGRRCSSFVENVLPTGISEIPERKRISNGSFPAFEKSAPRTPFPIGLWGRKNK